MDQALSADGPTHILNKEYAAQRPKLKSLTQRAIDRYLFFLTTMEWTRGVKVPIHSRIIVPKGVIRPKG